MLKTVSITAPVVGGSNQMMMLVSISRHVYTHNTICLFIYIYMYINKQTYRDYKYVCTFKSYIKYAYVLT
jgi:hypothetical protein